MSTGTAASGSRAPQRLRVGGRGALTVVLVAAFAASAATVELSALSGGTGALVDVVASITHPELSPDFLADVAVEAWRTVAYAVTGMTVGAAIGLPGAVLASGVLVRRRALRLPSSIGTRAGLGVVRAIHELVWALLFVQVFGLSPLAGVFAIGIPYGGIVGRVVAERLQDVPEAPLQALRTSGASEWQVMCYGRLPIAGADIASYLFYRFECAVRAAAILSFVGLGGLGLPIETAIDDLAFERIWAPLAALTLIIVAVDLVSARVRRRVLG